MKGLGRKPGPCGRCGKVKSPKKPGHWNGFQVMLCLDCKRITDQNIIEGGRGRVQTDGSERPEFEQMRQVMPRQVACPQCATGEPIKCRTASGVPVKDHLARWRALAKAGPLDIRCRKCKQPPTQICIDMRSGEGLGDVHKERGSDAAELAIAAAAHLMGRTPTGWPKGKPRGKRGDNP